MWDELSDITIERFNENTKILVVDGPIAAGKSTFAKQLAEELDMLYVPEADSTKLYVNKYGGDLRSLNPRLPPTAQYVDIEEFCRNPKHVNVGTMQMDLLMLRFEQYIDALAHLYNTGQGIILDRSVYSDCVFAETMFQSGYLTKAVKKYYDDTLEGIKLFLQRPHLVIYLDAPVSVVQKRIKERNRSFEVNSPVFTEKYLSLIERNYKEKFLTDMSVKSELLIYDWSEFGDVEVVVEDIETLDLEYHLYQKKFEDWRIDKDRELSVRRQMYTSDKHELLCSVDPAHLVPELIISHEDSLLRDELEKELPGARFEEGYNPSQGDSVLWKWK